MWWEEWLMTEEAISAGPASQPKLMSSVSMANMSMA